MFSQTPCVHPRSVFLHMQPSLLELVPINKVWRCLKMTASTVKQNTVIKCNYASVDPAHIQRKTLKGTINLGDFIPMLWFGSLLVPSVLSITGCVESFQEHDLVLLLSPCSSAHGVMSKTVSSQLRGGVKRLNGISMSAHYPEPVVRERGEGGEWQGGVCRRVKVEFHPCFC